MSEIKIPEKFESIEECNRIWRQIQEQKESTQNAAIDRIRENQKIKKDHIVEDKKYYNSVYDSILEDF